MHKFGVPPWAPASMSSRSTARDARTTRHGGSPRRKLQRVARERAAPSSRDHREDPPRSPLDGGARVSLRGRGRQLLHQRNHDRGDPSGTGEVERGAFSVARTHLASSDEVPNFGNNSPKTAIFRRRRRRQMTVSPRLGPGTSFGGRHESSRERLLLSSCLLAAAVGPGGRSPRALERKACWHLEQVIHGWRLSPWRQR